MKSMAKWVSAITLIVVTSISVTYAEDQHDHERKNPVSAIEALSPELRELLAQEMQALQKGMMSVIPAYASGNWREIEIIGTKMEASYILKQRISDEQVKQLHRLLPESFIKLDQQFHYYAGMLSHAARKGKSELVGFYFSKLNESCVACHSQYATHRFPGLIEKTDNHKHSH